MTRIEAICVNDSPPATPRWIPLHDVVVRDPSIRRDIDDAVRAVASGGTYIGGPAVASFERSFSKQCGACRPVVGVANGTDALFLALRALGIGPGDQVLTTALSFVASAQAITRCGAEIRFVNVEAEGWNLDPSLLEVALTERTRAIVAVHLFGRPAEMNAILAFAAKRGLAVVEDAAQAHGALYRGSPVGSLGRAAAFSFYPTKNLGAWGDAGAVVVDDEQLAVKVRCLANHAVSPNGDYQAEGFNSRLDALQAAVLDVKLSYLFRWNERRRCIADRYRLLLEDLPVGVPSAPLHLTQVHHVFPLRVEANRRDKLAAFLQSRGVETRVYYQTPLPMLAGYAATAGAQGEFPEAIRASRELLAIPIHPNLSDFAVERIADQIRRFFEG